MELLPILCLLHCKVGTSGFASGMLSSSSGSKLERIESWSWDALQHPNHVSALVSRKKLKSQIYYFTSFLVRSWIPCCPVLTDTEESWGNLRSAWITCSKHPKFLSSRSHTKLARRAEYGNRMTLMEERWVHLWVSWSGSQRPQGCGGVGCVNWRDVLKRWTVWTEEILERWMQRTYKYGRNCQKVLEVFYDLLESEEQFKFVS